MTGQMLTQDGPAWQFDYGVPEAPISSISVVEDGSSITFRAYAAGQGEAEGRPVQVVDDLTLLTTFGFALLESDVQAVDSEGDDDVLAAQAAGDIFANGRSIEVWTVRIRRDGTPNAGQIRVGDWCLIRVQGHAYIPDDTYELRVVHESGGGKEVELQMAPKIVELT